MVKRRFFIVIALFGLFFWSAPEVYAVEDTTTLWDTLSSEEIAPSSGTLMAAALESAGYTAQSIILRDLGHMFDRMATLIYLALLVSAIISVTIFGSYRGAAWLLVGPALLLFTLATRQVGFGAEWQWGAQTAASTEAVGNLIGEIRNEDGDLITEVSWLFDEYNKLISDAILQSIQIILNNDLRDRMKFMTRQRVFDHLFSSQVSEPSLTALIQWNFSQCGRELEAAREIAKGSRFLEYQDTIQYQVARGQYNNSWAERTKVVPTGPIRSYLVDVINGYGSAAAGDIINSADPDEDSVITYPEASVYEECLADVLEAGDPALFLARPVSCEEIWCLMGVALHTEVLKHMRAAEEGIMTPTNADPELRQEIWEDIMIKLADPQELVVGDDNEYRSPELSLIPVVLGGHLLKKTLRSAGVYSPGTSQFAENSGIKSSSFDLDLENMGRDELQAFVKRFLNERLMVGKRAFIYTISMYLPYLQGAALYILALTFPFFALMLIIPGKADAFFTWMGLWLWVKFWDLGWAFVIVVDDLLWNLMPHVAHYDPNIDPNSAPMTVLDTAFASDPSYSTGFYYTLIGMLLTSIPVLSAQVFLGAKAMIAQALFDGAARFAKAYERASELGIGLRHANSLEKLRSMHALNYQSGATDASGAPTISTATNADGTPKFALSQKVFDEANKIRAEAEIWKGGGVVAGTAAAAAAIGGAVKRGKGRLAIPGGVGALGGAYHALKGGVEMERLANLLEYQAFKMQEAERIFAVRKSKTDVNLQSALGSVRAGRIGYWFTLPSPDSLAAASNQTIEAARNDMIKLRTEYGAKAAGTTMAGLAGTGVAKRIGDARRRAGNGARPSGGVALGGAGSRVANSNAGRSAVQSGSSSFNRLLRVFRRK